MPIWVWRAAAYLLTASVAIPWAFGPGLLDLSPVQWAEVAAAWTAGGMYTAGIVAGSGWWRRRALLLMTVVTLSPVFRLPLEFATARAALAGDWLTVAGATCLSAGVAAVFFLAADREHRHGG